MASAMSTIAAAAAAGVAAAAAAATAVSAVERHARHLQTPVQSPVERETETMEPHTATHTRPRPGMQRPPQHHLHGPTPRLHETLLATMMARSAPSVLLHSRPVRVATKVLEIAVLAMSLTLAAILIALHTRFLHGEGCARVLVDADARFEALHENYARPHIVHLTVPAYSTLQTLTTKAMTTTTSTIPDAKNDAFTKHHIDRDQCVEGDDCSNTAEAANTDDSLYFRFARERGLLLLSEQALAALNITVLHLSLPPTNPCLGGAATVAALSLTSGYHAVVANAFLRLGAVNLRNEAGAMPKRPTSVGYVRAYPSGTLVNLGHVATNDRVLDSTPRPSAPFTESVASVAPQYAHDEAQDDSKRIRIVHRMLRKAGALMTGLFIMCTTSALVSFTLKEVQVRIVNLTIDLQYAMRSAAAGASRSSSRLRSSRFSTAEYARDAASSRRSSQNASSRGATGSADTTSSHRNRNGVRPRAGFWSTVFQLPLVRTLTTASDEYIRTAGGRYNGYARVLVGYATDALVFVPIVAGVLFFLFEFFDDQPLAFAVLVLAYLAEVATSGSTRHWVSRQYLPRLFFMYFGAFHFYFFSFPLGFTWLAFAACVGFMFHACLAIWNRFELPLMQEAHDSGSEWR